jgi:hypothetical protein
MLRFFELRFALKRNFSFIKASFILLSFCNTSGRLLLLLLSLGIYASHAFPLEIGLLAGILLLLLLLLDFFDVFDFTDSDIQVTSLGVFIFRRFEIIIGNT